MATKDDTRARAPRGTRNVTQAFFTALDGLAEAQQAGVATAALAAIRDALKARRLKAREAAAKAKAKAPAKMKAAAKAPRKAKVAAVAKRAPARKAAAKPAPAKRAIAKKAAKRKAPAKLATPPAPEAVKE